MIEALRPSTLGEILDRTVNLYRTHFLVFVGIAALPAGVVLVSAAIAFLFFAWLGTEGQTAGPALIGTLSILFLAASALILLPLCAAATGLGTAALNQAATCAFVGEKITIRDAYKSTWKRGWQYIWLFVQQTALVVIAPAVAGGLLIFILGLLQLLAVKSTGASILVGLLVFAILGAMAGYALWMLLSLCLGFPACVVESSRAWAAVKRSFSLSKGTRARMLVLYVLGAVLGWILSLLLTVPVLAAAAIIPGMDSPKHAQAIGTLMFFAVYGSWFAVQAFTKPVYAIALLLFYYDQRIRKEAFDIEWLMRRAGMVEAPAVQPEAAPWMPAAPASPPLTESRLVTEPEQGSAMPGQT